METKVLETCGAILGILTAIVMIGSGNSNLNDVHPFIQTIMAFVYQFPAIFMAVIIPNMIKQKHKNLNEVNLKWKTKNKTTK